MDYSLKTIPELKELCKENNIKGVSNKNKTYIISALNKLQINVADIADNAVVDIVDNVVVDNAVIDNNRVITGDSIVILPTLADLSAQIIIADPPYNIGKDFGNDSDKQPMDVYLLWCDTWIKECLRILKDNGTMFIYGFSENLALILSRIPLEINRRWVT